MKYKNKNFSGVFKVIMIFYKEEILTTAFVMYYLGVETM